jgi:pimeloyl-ACP methyl ester carboxylesterase
MQHSLRTTDGVTISYRLEGPPHGLAIVLCHGICASGRQFASDADRFAALGYRVIVPDLRAHGTSGAPSLGSGDFSIARLATDMQGVLDEAGAAQVHWLGNSLGGIVGLALLSKAPSRFLSFATFGTAYSLNLPRVAPGVLPLLYRLLGPRLLGRVTAALTTADPKARALIAAEIAAFDPGPGERIAEAVRTYDLVTQPPLRQSRCSRSTVPRAR